MIGEYIPQVLAIVGGLVALTNIITQVVKQWTAEYVSTNIVATAVSMILTLVAFFAWCSMHGVVITWYSVVAAIVVGFLVAYAAMFGFDKLKQALEAMKG